MFRRTLLILAGAVLLIAIAGCKPKAGSPLYDNIAASNFGLKIGFDMSPADVQSVLGKPQAEQKSQAGKVVEDYYLPGGVTGTDRESPQLSCTFSEGKLIKLYNRYFPEDTDKLQPPFFMEVLPKVKLGSRKSDLVTALGKPTSDEATTAWQFTGADKRMVTILARFVNVEGVGDQMCCMLQVVRSEIIEEPRGEDLEKPPAVEQQGQAAKGGK